MVLRQSEAHSREIPPKSLAEVGGSVYLMGERYLYEFRGLLKRFEGPELKWREFLVEAQRWSPKVCTAVHTHGILSRYG